MAITLMLREEADDLVVTFDNQTIKTALDKIPAIKILQADPFTNGQVLTAALGGNEMLKRLAGDPDNLILLDCDDTADAIAWEFATLPDRQFLCVRAGMLRTVPHDAPPVSGNGELNFIALAADPLVDQSGNPWVTKDSDGNLREDHRRLDLDNEMEAIRETLKNCGKNLEAKRIPPTREELYKALRKGPALLHLSCHGNVVLTEYGPMAMLMLEKNDGSVDPFLGSDLMNSKRGILRMVVLSACKTATGTEANLARALALNGVPMTVGMRGSILDKLSDDFATALYDSLFQGFTFGEALQQARQNISQDFDNVGFPVGYVSTNGWSEKFPIQLGTPIVDGLHKLGKSALGGEIQAPRPLLGRNMELHQIAKLFANGHKVITVAGTGGMGKTALAAAFAERFAWLWAQGVRGYSFANEVNPANFRYALMRVLFGEEGAQKGASLSEIQQREEILRAAREWSGLWLFDNYESIIQGIQEKQPEAESIHRLIADLANGDADLLLTSREQPAGLRNERLFPDGKHALRGLGDEAGVELFFQHSVKAKENPEAHIQFALDIQHAAEGHPLAIALLAGEYDVSAVAMDAFLKDWQGELANARRSGLAGHHVTFAAAFERSYSHLNADLQTKLALLSVFPFPFFAQGATIVWGETEDDDNIEVVKQTLNEFTRRSLLEVDTNFTDKTPATYRFQPALRQEAARRLDGSLIASQENAYAAYGAWLAKRGYGGIHSNIALNRVIHLSMDAMEKASNSLLGEDRLWHIGWLAWLKNSWGETRVAFELLNSAISENFSVLQNGQTEFEGSKVQSFLRFQLADACMRRGDHDRAFQLYQELLQLHDKLGNKKSTAIVLQQIGQILEIRDELNNALLHYERAITIQKEIGDTREVGVTLNNMALVYRKRGDFDRALLLNQESLKIKEAFGDIQGRAATLGNMANIHMFRKDWEQAEKFLLEALDLVKSIGEPPAFEIVRLGQVAQGRGDKETALSRYREGLAIFERMGMPDANQVRQLIFQLEGGAAPNDNPLAHLIAQARNAAQRGDVESAIQYQEQAVSLTRAGRGELVGLSIMLYNLAGYYQKAERHDEAIKAMEEVVAIDEKTNHQDLESDRETLEVFRRISSLTPVGREKWRQQTEEESESSQNEEVSFEVQLQAQLAGLPPEQRARAEAQIRKAFEEFQRMSPEQQAAVMDQNRRIQIENAANEVRDAALAYVRKQAPKNDILNYLNDLAQKAAEGEKPGSPWLDVAALSNALIALIKGESNLPVPPMYASHFSAVQSEMKKE